MSTSLLIESVRRVALVAERNTAVRLTFAPGNLTLEAGTGDEAQADEVIEASFDGDELSIAFNPNYLLDGLAAMDSDTTGSPSPSQASPRCSPASRTPTAPPNYRYLLMPFRLNSASRRGRAKRQACIWSGWLSPTSASYESADVALAPGVTTFTGPNGAGKTNLIEAACYVATFGSHRVVADAAMIRSGADRAILRAALRSAVRDSLVEIELNSGRANRVRLNRAPLTRPRDALGTLRCVLFAPEDLAIVKGDPAERRRYLDDLLVASRPRYRGRPGRLRARGQAAQRAAQVRPGRGRGRPPGLEVWDDQLVDKGAELTAGPAAAGCRRCARWLPRATRDVCFRPAGRVDQLPAGV